MAKAVALIAFALGLLAISGNAQWYTSDITLKSPNKFDVNYTNAQGYVNKFSVEGDVLCATCKLNSETDADQLGHGELEIRCRSRKNGTVTLIQPTLADNGGCWKTYVEDGHQDDLCMVRVVASPDPQCNAKVAGFRSVRITLADFKQNGLNTLYVKKPLGFVKNEALPNCRKVRSKRGNLVPAITEAWANPKPATKLA
ncbi:hypothetical protein RHSIM_Rhsim04G0026000 [Rhododendron simsii]|uniref:Uncharacterized protein n=1 Tax=Rhododendron simsii TaxID=118357 RepID=A0A834HAH3_RHOSS|nr:hypothetical protein RHSIM_Rhsim04G0026000 [Rhododendron simsii]